MGLISDIGGPAAEGTTFYYNIGSGEGGFSPVNSFAPGPAGVSKLVQSWSPSDVFAIGDLAYNAGGSTLMDISIGQYYNNFIHPYPARKYLRAPYAAIDGKVINNGQRHWPYNIYNYPHGFPSPISGGLRGGSPDKSNRFWASLGNHDYGRYVGYSQVGLTDYNFDGKYINQPVGPSSTLDVQAAVDYLMPFLENPSLLGRDRARLNIGAVDTSGNRGVYYSISRGGTVDAPLVEVIMLDTERLNINAGYESWNPTGSQIVEGGKFVNAVPAGKDDDPATISQRLNYDPTRFDPNDPNTIARAGTTTDPDNGYDQFLWLKQTLAASKAKWTILTGHHPPYASGRWGDRQADDHMSNPYLQRLLKALPAGSFDAFYSGHNHFYERVLESNSNGIGLGIPFITNGNSGRNLEKKIQNIYGGSIYEPLNYKGRDPKDPAKTNPNNPALSANSLLPSGPVMTGSSGLSGDGPAINNGFSNGKYGYGFGATKMDATEDYLLFHYQEALLSDPAIANHLPGGVAPEVGFMETTAADWIPNPGGSFKGREDLAIINLTIENGVVTNAEIAPGQGGRGYMSSKNGNHTVTGFNVYGNNVDILRPWLKTAQLDLTFEQGSLTKVVVTKGGSGYELAAAAAEDNNAATSSQKLQVGLNYNIEEIQYLVRDDSLYNDFYMITDTQANVQLLGQAGGPGLMKVSIGPNSSEATALLEQELEPTTGYSGVEQQRFSAKAQDGDFIVYHNGSILAQGNLDDGLWIGSVTTLPNPSDPLIVDFKGDPITSYNVNFKPSIGPAIVTSTPDLPRAGQSALLAWTNSGSEPGSPWHEPIDPFIAQVSGANDPLM